MVPNTHLSNKENTSRTSLIHLENINNPKIAAQIDTKILIRFPNPKPRNLLNINNKHQYPPKQTPILTPLYYGTTGKPYPTYLSKSETPKQPPLKSDDNHLYCQEKQ